MTTPAPGPRNRAAGKPRAVFFWRKLDHPGHDSCRLFEVPGGWLLSGAAVFLEARHACHFHYQVRADRGFRCRSAKVSGYLGRSAVDIRIRSAGSGRWRVDGEVRSDLDGCLDIDLGFTPATNLLVLRRLALAVGEQADAPAAYLSFPRMRFIRLPQHYRRITAAKVAYESPSHGYAGTLVVSALGAVVRYPGLFELVEPA